MMQGLTFIKRAVFAALSLTACLLIAEAPAAARGPSFGCRAAAAADERAICRNAELSNLDRQLAQAFYRARSKLGARKARNFAGQILRARQRCGANPECIKRAQVNGLDLYQVAGVLPATASLESEPPELSIQRQAPARPEPKPPPIRAAKPEAAKPKIIRLHCQIDSCGFAKLYSVSPVLRSERGVLTAVWASSVSVKAPADAEGLPDYGAIRAPDKFPPPTGVALVFCSTATPILVTQDDTTAELEAFPLAVGNAKLLAGASVSDHLYYWAVCHDEILTEDELYSAEVDRKAKKLGYLDREAPSIDADSVSFKSLNELYAYLQLN